MRLNLPFNNCERQTEEKRFHKNLFMQDFVENNRDDMLLLDDSSSSSEDEDDDNDLNVNKTIENASKPLALNQTSAQDERKKIQDETESWEERDCEYMDEESQFDTYLKSNQNHEFFNLNYLSVPLIDTIAEFSKELSNEEFFINDLSFIFEMARKRAISPYAIIVALLYLKRLKQKLVPQSSLSKPVKNSNPRYKFYEECCTGLSNSELCLISILLATKFLIDEGENEELYNSDWAKASRMSIKEINALEKKFLNRLNWELYISSDEFWNFTNSLTEKITRKKIKLQCNQCTYSDLECLISFSNQFSLDSLKSLFKLLAKITLVCLSVLVYLVLSSVLCYKSFVLAKLYLSTLNPQTAHLQFNATNQLRHEERPTAQLTFEAFQNDRNSQITGCDYVESEAIQFIEQNAVKNRICSLDKLIQEKSEDVKESLDALNIFRIDSTKNITIHFQDHFLNKFNTLNWFY